jgi:predicted RNA-binding protein with PUA-like domain
MSTWLLKTEPETYSWDDLVKDGATSWDKVRNYTARNNLRAMKKGDLCFIYHSVGPREIVGIAEVVKESYPDPTATGDEAKKGWLAVDIKPKRPLNKPVALADIKAHKLLSKMVLVKQSRLSVCPVTPAEEKAILALAT